jgi:hypothetical protein
VLIRLAAQRLHIHLAAEREDGAGEGVHRHLRRPRAVRSGNYYPPPPSSLFVFLTLVLYGESRMDYLIVFHPLRSITGLELK